MKYGQQLEHESAPQWSLHNLDYNSLKHEIKVHTTRDQAAAIAIPGHQDPALRRFEDALYLELCRQHERLDLFATSKADEIARRLDHLDANVRRWAAKQHRADDGGDADDGEADSHLATSESLRRQRRSAKYERLLLRCGEDIHALERFARAQVVAFRKIVKKYRKWTGSTTLGSRFSEDVLRDPKSFTHRDFTQLLLRHDEILAALRAATPQFSDTGSPSSDEQPSPSSPSRLGPRVGFEPLPPPAESANPQIKYWNEYDDGSEAGGPEDEYAIYVDPEDNFLIPGLGYVQSVLSVHLEKARRWLWPQQSAERRPLLSGAPPSLQGYASTTTAVTDTDSDGYASSVDFPTSGYAALYALPSVDVQRVIRYRERVLFWATIGCFAASFVLLAIAGILISTGRHKLRVEVDAGVTVGVVVSMFCACSALGMTLYRRDPLGVSYQLMVWSAFTTACILNGMLLVLVVGNTP